MSLIIGAEPDLEEKTKELCEALLAQSEYKTAKEKIEAFLSDESAKQEYISLTELGNELQMKRQSGVELSEEEIDKYKGIHETALKNETVSGFMAAQEQLSQMAGMVNAYVQKTIELGEIPSADQLSSGGCCGGSGEASCGC